jgi:tetratricopeptide (TPR) repeat protein
MTATGRGKTASVANRVRIERPWRHITKRGWESAARYASVVRGYDLSKIETASLEPLALLYKSVGAKYAEEQVLREVIGRGGDVDREVYFEAVLFVTHRLRGDDQKRAEVLSILDAAEKILMGKANLRARIIRERGDVYLYYEHDLERALGEYDKVVGRFAERLEDHIVRITKIRIGDIHRKKGDCERAEAAYRDAERFRLHGIRGNPAVRRGILLHEAETELARGNYEEATKALDILEWEFPLEKLKGQTSVLRATVEIKRGNTAEALVQLDDLLRVAPRSNSAAEALYLAAGVERLLGRTAEAVRRYERLAKEYPDSPRAADAVKIVGRLREE